MIQITKQINQKPWKWSKNSCMRLQQIQNCLIFCRSSHQRCPIKKVFLEILQNLQENTCARVSFLLKLQIVLCKETQWLFKTQNRTLHKLLKKQIIKNKLKADVDHVNPSFLKKYLYAMTKMTNVLRNL